MCVCVCVCLRGGGCMCTSKCCWLAAVWTRVSLPAASVRRTLLPTSCSLTQAPTRSKALPCPALGYGPGKPGNPLSHSGFLLYNTIHSQSHTRTHSQSANWNKALPWAMDLSLNMNREKGLGWNFANDKWLKRVRWVARTVTATVAHPHPPNPSLSVCV